MHRIAVGWSHETWLFDLTWREGGTPHRRGLCLRRDPGNALLRHLSSLEDQFRVLQCLANTPLPTPAPYWFESDPAILDGPFRAEKGAGSLPESVGPGRAGVL